MTVATPKWTIDEYHRIIAVGILDERPMKLLKKPLIRLFTDNLKMA
ncbi:MAG: hypothetical protein ACYTXC_17035 [Nostoc sp.]